MKNKFIIAFLMLSASCFGQDTKGTIKVKKVEMAKVDTSQISVITIDTTIGFGFFSMINMVPKSSYGKQFDRQPQFIGDEKRFVDGIRVYPDCYKCKGATVFTELTILVNEDGSLTDVVVKKGATDCAKCDEEAIRIVKLMPSWQPAQYQGKNISLKWDTSITFTYLK